MRTEDKIKMFNDVFAPKKDEKILFLIDKPHDDINETRSGLNEGKWSKIGIRLLKK